MRANADLAPSDIASRATPRDRIIRKMSCFVANWTSARLWTRIMTSC